MSICVNIYENFIRIYIYIYIYIYTYCVYMIYGYLQDLFKEKF